jgi:predicted dehydrogenase
MEKIKVGIIGCGNISGIYFENLLKFDNVELAACADLVPAASEAASKKWGVKAVSVKELLADKGIKIAVNLTIPKAHAEVALAAVTAGKSVHNEKPLTIQRKDAQKLLKLAKTKKLLVGCAPDTFLGGSHQTCRKIIEDGIIGEPVAATAFMMCHGHESWHPAPEFYYKVGGGPMLDMGPYYITALVNMMGPVKRVCGSAKITFKERLITSQPKNGTVIKVETPTHIAGTMDFANGAIGTIITSFDIWAHTLPCIEVHGTKGSMQVPDPNGFGGPIKVRLSGEKEWKEIPSQFGYMMNSRGVGPADMAKALVTGKVNRCSGELAYHVLDVMHSFMDSSKANKHILLKSKCRKPAIFPEGMIDYKLA